MAQQQEETIRASWQATLNDKLIDLWEPSKHSDPSVTIKSEEREILMDHQPRKDAVNSSEELRLNFGLYTFRNPITMVRNFGLLLGEMEEHMEVLLVRPVRIDCTIFRSYAEGQDALLLGKVDFMRVGPASYLLMKQKAIREKQPVVSLLAAQDDPIECAIFTRANSGITSLSQLEGKSFAFGDRDSTYGTYLAKWALLEFGIQKDNLPNSQHFRSHDQVVEAVITGTCDAGSANMEAILKHDPDREITRDLYDFADVQSMPMPYVATGHLGSAVVGALRKALQEENSPSVLESIAPKLAGFREVSDQDFDHLLGPMERAAEFGELEE